MEDEQETTPIIFEQKSSVKLIKGARAYRWEIKVYDNDTEKLLPTIDKLDKKCRLDYGEEPEA